MVTSSPVIKAKKLSFTSRLQRDMKMNIWKYVLILPVLVYLGIFAYKPMYGLIIAFKDYRPGQTYAGAEWVGVEQFFTFFNDIYFLRLIQNTFTLSALSIVFGFPAPILLALLLNEVRHTGFKRTVQTITYMPYFISLVVACSLIKIYSLENGLFTRIVVAFGGTQQNLLLNPAAFRPLYVISGIWQGVGWNSIIYLAALSGIDQALYEAARIDGANRFQQILHITIPGILPTIMILFILRMGSILNVGYEKVLLMYSDSTRVTADVISTYTYRAGLINARYSYSTAVGLFNTFVNIAFLLATNFVSKKTTESGLF